MLIVDDNDMNRMILREILEDDYPLIEAATGEEDVDMAREHRPGLVLLDIMMPGMNGYDACTQIKRDAEASGALTNVILVSAKASPEERVRGYESGADDYVVKPFDDEELLAKVRVQLRLRDALEEAAEARALVAMDNDRLKSLVNEQAGELIGKRDMIVFALAKLADSRDPETGEHLQRIREYCKVLAEELGQDTHAGVIDQDFIDAIYLASPLHDIGKVGIPDTILLKPGRLTDLEFDLMKEHCAIGADALEEVARHGEDGLFLRMAIQIARSHHERWDGTGYPDKLAGEAIPLAARITAVADVFDALTSARVYKEAFTTELARSMIEQDRGSHFDPAIVDAFLRRYENMCRLRLTACDIGSADTLAA